MSAIQHLKLLGYNPGDQIHYRAFLPGCQGSGRKTEAVFPELPPKLEQWQVEGRGIYVVVNSGGHCDKDINCCKAVFYEHDDIDAAESRDLWQSLDLPKLTFQVSTGGKSVHSYWVFKEPVNSHQWRLLQSDLLDFADGDRTLKNPSRVMRLAGYAHPSTGQQSQIICQHGQQYSFHQLRLLIPQQKNHQRQRWSDFAQDFSLPWQEAVPLEVSLSPSSRALIESGVSEGSRNTAGAKLVRDLLGTTSYLNALALVC